MRYLCDHMLIKLGKWLRAAGYDTQVVRGNLSDDEIAHWALKENRIIITRDRLFKKKENSDSPILLLTNTLEENVLELSKKTKMNWLYRPFSRCLVCNAELQTPDEKTISELVPPDILLYESTYWFCDRCKKVYWNGSHAQNMLKKLETWQKKWGS